MDARGAPVTGDQRWADPRWGYPEYPAGSVVEIRVHGVGGEPPSGMARDPHPRLVGGDQLAGFWRARNPVIRPLTGAADGPVHAREVLSWGGQTSGTVRHAFWVLLLPFALLNFVGRMHAHDPDTRRSAGYRAVTRALAFTLTLILASLLCGLAFDLLGAQCASQPDCLRGPGTEDGSGFGSASLAPLRYVDGVGRMGLLALIPVLALVGLWWAGRYATGQLEGREDDRPDARPSEPVRIQDPSFWRNEWPTSRLRATHATGVLAFIGATLCLALLEFAPPGQQALWWRAGVAPSVAVILACGVVTALPATVRPGRDPALHHLGWVLRLAALTPLTTATVLALYGHEAGEAFPAWAEAWPGGGVGALLVAGAAAGLGAVGWWARRSWRTAAGERPDTRLATNLVLAGGVGLMALALAATGRVELRDQAITIGALPDSFAWLGGWAGERLEWLNRGVYLPAYALLVPLAGAQIALVTALAILGADGAVPQRPGRGPLTAPAVAGNLGGAVVALLALLVVSAAGASLHALALDWLGFRVEAGQPASDGEVGLVLPWGYGYTAVVTTLVLPLVLLAVFSVRQAAAGRTVRKADEDTVADDLSRGFEPHPPGEPRPDRDRRRLQAIAKGWRTEHLVRDAGSMLAWAILVTVILIIARFLWVATDWPTEVTLAEELPPTTAAVWATTGIAGAAVGLLRTALREQGTRRNIGRLWDVLTFWPRVTHPFAPPCYAEAVVPLLHERARRLLAAPQGYRVVLAGHSQGSVVALASVVAADLGEDSRERIALVTYGSPIAILYERFFPGVFGPAAAPIRDAEDRVGSWHHFFAMTEPFAGPFWHVPVDGAEPAGAGGWPLHRLVTHADAPCPVCGWSRSGVSAAEPKATCADIVVTDPDRWTQPLDSLGPTPRGHSAYHDHREVDLHLSHIAALLCAAPGSDGTARPRAQAAAPEGASSSDRR